MKEKKNQKKKKQRKLKFKKIAIIRIALFLALIISIVCIVPYYYNSLKNKQLYDDLDVEIDIATEEISKVNSAFVEKVKELQEENSDTKGWIRIEGTKINYPLVQTFDNDYYVLRNFKKEQSKYGSIFINCNSNIKDVNSNVIIYGHDMKDEQMFRTIN